jgi:hypothetical protein
MALCRCRARQTSLLQLETFCDCYGEQRAFVESVCCYTKASCWVDSMRIVGMEDREQFSAWCEVLRRETSELACVNVESSIAQRACCLQLGLLP